MQHGSTHNVDSDFPGAAGSHVDIVPPMQLYGGALEPSATPQELRREVIGQVEREVRGEAAYTFNTCTMYMKFWSKSYAFTIIQFLITYSVQKWWGKAWIIFSRRWGGFFFWTFTAIQFSITLPLYCYSVCYAAYSCFGWIGSPSPADQQGLFSLCQFPRGQFPLCQFPHGQFPLCQFPLCQFPFGQCYYSSSRSWKPGLVRVHVLTVCRCQ